MATIAIIILAMIGVGVIMGLMKGFVKQMASIVAVSYTHLDVYKRQIMSWRIPFLFNGVWGLITLFYICLLYTSRCV